MTAPIKYFVVPLESDKTGLYAGSKEMINQLIGQLSSRAQALEEEEILEIMRTAHVVVARIESQRTTHIVGMAMLFVRQKFTGRVGYIDDVVVYSEFRGQGIGEKLTRALIDEARRRECKEIDLTSNPKRVAANRLYEKLGFERRETNVYRYVL